MIAHEIIYPMFAIATLCIALAIVLIAPLHALQHRTLIAMIASVALYMLIASSAIGLHDMQLATLALVTGILGAIALDNFSLQPKVKYGVVMA